MMSDTDITDRCDFDLNDDELLPLTKCACGTKFAPWDFILGIYRDAPKQCPQCGRLLYFSVRIMVVSIGEENG
jgi:hypothetical protein